MHGKITQPVGIVSMTNVAIIKYKINNKKFEIACYKNKAIDWRNGIEKDLSEVLQIDEIYTAASHGDIASHSDLQMYFPDMSKTQIIQTILNKGDLQIGEKERDVQMDSMFKQIVKFIQEKCVHPQSKRIFSVQSIEHAISKTNFILKADQPVKPQALFCIKLLQEKFNLQRAELKIQITGLANDKQQILQHLTGLEIPKENIIVEKEDPLLIAAIMNPSILRPLSLILKDNFQKAVIQVIEYDIANRNEEDIENAAMVELELKNPQLQQQQQFVEVDDEDKKKKKNKKKKNDKQKSKPHEQEEEEQKQQTAQQQKEVKNPKQEIKQQQTQKKQFTCSMCIGAEFDTNQEFRQHYKSDWHNFNLKLKNQGKPFVDNEEYLEFLLKAEMQK